MRFRSCAAIATFMFASAILVPSVSAQAQTGPQNHDAHHPPGTAPAQPGAPPASSQGGMMDCCSMMGGQGGMMGQQMGQQTGTPGSPTDMRPIMPMMQNMMAMMSAQTGMMTPHVEGRIAALKTQLKITEAQTPQWNRFAEALRATAKSMNEMHQPMMMMQPGKAAKPLPDQIAAREQAMSAHLASLKAVHEALQPLYASFSDDQKKIADGLMIGPMGMM